MDSQFQEDFVVYVREQRSGRDAGQPAERELVHCASYEEAEWVRDEYESPRRRCIIRYLGPAGGGD